MLGNLIHQRLLALQDYDRCGRENHSNPKTVRDKCDYPVLNTTHETLKPLSHLPSSIYADRYDLYSARVGIVDLVKFNNLFSTRHP
jgi:hypothetical protein